MVLFMIKMSFAKWSKLDEEEQRREVTFMDREVAGGWYDFMSLDRNFRFRNFERNCPDLEQNELYRTDATYALENMTIESSVYSDNESDDEVNF